MLCYVTGPQGPGDPLPEGVPRIPLLQGRDREETRHQGGGTRVRPVSINSRYHLKVVLE